jgi:hypothetical protein
MLALLNTLVLDDPPQTARIADHGPVDELQSHYRKIGIAAVAGALAASRQEPKPQSQTSRFPEAGFYRAAWRKCSAPKPAAMDFGANRHFNADGSPSILHDIGRA